MSDTPAKTLADNRLPGIQAIADYVGETYRQAQWKVETGVYPTTRHGKIVVALKSEIDRVHRPDTGKAA